MDSIFSYGFMQRALAAGILVSILCSLLSFFVVLKRLSFVGAGISHAAFGGVALGFFLGLEPTWTAAVFCVLVALLIGMVKEKGSIAEDTAIGIFFAATMAFGVLLVGLSKQYNVDLFTYLFGNILAITTVDLKAIIAVALPVLIIYGLFFKEMLFCSFDAEIAEISGVPTRFFHYLFLVLLALVIVVAIKVVGIMLVSALLVIPAATGRLLTHNYRGMLAVSVVAGVASTVGGLFLSYPLDIPSGATIVLLATGIFLSAFFIRSAKR